MSQPKLEITEDFTENFNKIVKSFKRDEVLIGVPEEDSQRDGSIINNATLLAINEFGSPQNNIPARPVMSIGLRNAKDEIAEQFKLAVQKSFSQGIQALNFYYNRAGIIASNAVKKAINAQDGIAAPADSTIAARKARGFIGKKALIVTGQLRNSITYVVKGGK